MRMSRRRALGALAALPLISRPAWAQQNAFPTRPVRLLVGFAPGGLTDIAARALAERMGKTLKQNVVVENRPGGQAIIATVAVARAEPDGYTLGFAGTNGMILNPLLYNNLPYYALHPPVYYSYPVPRTYGYSPFAYPPGVMTPEAAGVQPLEIINPYVPTPQEKPVSAKKDRTAAVTAQPEPLVIVNPFVSSDRAVARSER